MKRRNKAESSGTEPKKGWWEKYMAPIIITVVSGVILFALTHYFEKPKPSAPSVQIQTHGDKSPVVQGNQNTVSVDNSTPEQQNKNPQNSKPDTAEGHK